MRLSKVLWSMLCGTALGLGGCNDCASDMPADEPAQSPGKVEKPAETSPPAKKVIESPPKLNEAAEAEESELIDVYGPPPP